MRNVLICSALAMAACVPATGQRGVGFDDGLGAYRASREDELSGTAGPILVEPTDREVITGGDLAAAGIGDGAAAGASTFGEGTAFEPGGTATNAPATPSGNAGISDEQDFSAVSSRESIQSDAERLNAQRQAYRVIEPEPVPERPADTGPNIVAYALSTTNQPGERIYSRSGLLAETRFTRNCSRYATSDQAQEAFLEAGGPRRDRMGLDPDGDGFACYWDPRPFRAAREG